MQYIFKNTIEQSICGQQINRSAGKHGTAAEDDETWVDRGWKWRGRGTWNHQRMIIL